MGIQELEERSAGRVVYRLNRMVMIDLIVKMSLEKGLVVKSGSEQ